MPKDQALKGDLDQVTGRKRANAVTNRKTNVNTPSETTFETESDIEYE
jgi:hypothetical protein